ncbi:DUF7509 family protein [Natronococcus amylolyticus]|uniref:DUF7509 family protein n=1 Tax=Natronococcus amylolyticus TaxID=44470 RepID=UPI001F4C6ADC|nr:hypothetical protein [Natronococcus amylolyticus]
MDDIIRESIPYSDPSDRLVLLMGPYRLLDPGYLYQNRDFNLPPDPLAPSEGAEPDLIETTLRAIAKQVSEETPATVFIASDVDIPTKTEVGQQELKEPGMSVIDQSVAFAKVSAGNAFVFTKAGLTTGVGAESGAIPEYFDLRDSDQRTRNPQTFCIFAEAERNDGDGKKYDPKFSSASIDEMDDAYSLRYSYFADQDDLVSKITTFVESYVVPLSQ